MYIFKKVLTKAFYFVLVCLLLMPVGILYVISQNEQLQYQTEAIPVVDELAYGDVVPILLNPLRSAGPLSARQFFSQSLTSVIHTTSDFLLPLVMCSIQAM